MGAATMDKISDEERVTDLMKEIASLAPRKRHRLAKDMVNGTRRLALPAALMVVNKLRQAPDIENAPPEQPAPAPRETPVQAVIQAVAQRQASRTPPPMSAFKDLPEGFFATPSRTGSNDLDFWKLHHGKGKWKDSIFAKRMLGGIGEDEGYRTVELDNMQMRLACTAITEYGADESQALFAEKMRRCIDCASPLSDEESRAARRGPDCRKKHAKRNG